MRRLSSRPGAERVDPVLGFLDAGEYLLGLAQEKTARVGQFHLLGGAPEKGTADLRLELRELLGQGRLGQPKLLGGPRQGFRVRDRPKNPDLVQGHFLAGPRAGASPRPGDAFRQAGGVRPPVSFDIAQTNLPDETSMGGWNDIMKTGLPMSQIAVRAIGNAYRIHRAILSRGCAVFARKQSRTIGRILLMNKMVGVVAGVLVSLAISGAATAQQQSGQVGTGAPEDIFLTLTLDADKNLTVSQNEFHLAWGGYYRLNMECPDSGPVNEASIAFASPGLWQNSHLRLASVSERASGYQQVEEINFHIQGEQLRLMECEGLPLDVRFSFYPMKKGTYPFTLLNSTVKPAVEMTGKFIVE